MMLSVSIASVLLLLCSEIRAQESDVSNLADCIAPRVTRRCVVIDMETKVPQRDVAVRWDGKQVMSIWDGSFVADSIVGEVTLSKPGYVQYRLNADELTDTLELLPAYNKLSEVTVWGHDKTPKMGFTLKMPSKTDLALARGGQSGVSIPSVIESIYNLVNYKKRKRTARIKKQMSEY